MRPARTADGREWVQLLDDERVKSQVLVQGQSQSQGLSSQELIASRAR